MTVKGSPIDRSGWNKCQITAGNFVDLVQRVCDGLMFHRLVRQPQPSGGDPQSKDPNFPPQSLGTGGFIDPKTGAPRYIPLEIKPAGASSDLQSNAGE